MAACKLAVLPQAAILQDEVELLISLENQMHTLRREYDELAGDLLARRMAGVPVEPGSYDLEVVEDGRAGRREFRLVVR